MENRTVGILGCGWFGLPFAKTLVKSGYEVKGSTTRTAKLKELEESGIRPYQINLNDTGELPPDFFDVDVLFISVPPRAKSEDVSQYPKKMSAVVKAAEGKVKHLVFISSVGIFEDGNSQVDENSIPQPDTDAGRALLAAEAVFNSNTKFETTIIRFAGLIGPGRNLAKFFAGRNHIPNGEAPINLIVLEDCIGICLQLLAKNAFGRIYHAVCPHHPTRADFYTALAKNTGYETPEFVCEKGTWKQIDSFNVPRILNYEFMVSNWFSWIAEQDINSL
ncbi:NAD(P)H-binding protein [Pedobacter montanisoli]|uniref:NAD(P)H-binding protein n=1 Tax=Pedobacter montanisoli TaxID=2923277 RepID=A0ABS9ZTZ1_9SPHI|nr:NAD(P)H-binding protein [Pedobacter montanisoli]MCJ0742086.1 NAD(P)H-binding protein [Pedobacter montanisoli]